MLCLCHDGPTLLRFWFQTNRGCENSASYLKYRRGRPFITQVMGWLHCTFNFYAVIGQNFTGEFMRKIYAASWNLFTLTADPDSLVSTCDVFNCLFPPDVQNEIQLLSRVFCYLRLVCLLFFWLRHASPVKIGNLISDVIVFVFHLAWCILKRVQNSQAILALLDSF